MLAERLLSRDMLEVPIFNDANAGFCRLMTKLRNKYTAGNDSIILGNIYHILHHACLSHKDFDLIFLNKFILEIANIIFQAIELPNFQFFQSVRADNHYHLSNFSVILCLHYYYYYIIFFGYYYFNV